MGEEETLGQQLEEAATRYREAKARQDHLGEQSRFAEAALKALQGQLFDAHLETERALSTVLRLTRGETIPKTEPNPGVAGCGYGYVPEALKA